MFKPSLQALVLAAAVFAASSALAVGEDSLGGWAVSNVGGAVVYLSGDRWEELVDGEQINDPFVRTLRRAHAVLARNGITVGLGEDSVVEIKVDGSSISIIHLAGNLNIDCAGARKLVVQTGALQITDLVGSVDITLTGTGAIVDVIRGGLAVTAPRQKPIKVSAGQELTSDLDGKVAAVTSLPTTSKAAAKGQGQKPDAATGQGNASGGAGNASGGNANSSGGNANSSGGNGNSSGGNANSSGGNANSSGGNANSSGGNANSSGGNANSSGANSNASGGGAGASGGASGSGGSTGSSNSGGNASGGSSGASGGSNASGGGNAASGGAAGPAASSGGSKKDDGSTNTTGA